MTEPPPCEWLRPEEAVGAGVYHVVEGLVSPDASYGTPLRERGQGCPPT